MSSNELAIKIKALGAPAAAAAVKDVNDEVRKTGTHAKTSAKGLDGASKSTDRFDGAQRRAAKGARGLGSALGSGIKMAAGFGAALVGVQGLKASVDTTRDLANSTIALNRALGSDAPKDAAESYAAIFASRGIDTNKAVMGFKKLSAQIVGAGNKSKTSLKTFKALGISQAFLAKNGNNLDLVNRKVADAFSEMDDGAQKTALGNQLYGRSWGDLVKVLGSGSAAMDEEIAKLREYGVITGKGTDGAKDLAKAQRESKIATMGLQVMIGSQLIPVLLRVSKATIGFFREIRSGDGAFKTVRDVITTTFGVFQQLTHWFTTSKDASKALGYALTLLLVAFAVQKVIAFGAALRGLWLVTTTYRVAVIAITFAMRGLGLAFALARAGMIGLTAAMLANPIGLIIVAIVALVAGFVIAYKKIGWFRNAVNSVWRALKSVGQWVASNWKILLAPLIAPILLAVFAFNKLKGSAGTVVAFVRQKFSALVSFFTGLPGRFLGAAKSIGRTIVNGIVDGIKAAPSALMDALGSIIPGPLKDAVGGVAGLASKVIPGLATGGAIVRSGLTWVGERGPELLRLPAGAEVTDSQTSMALARTAPMFTGSSPAVSGAGAGSAAFAGGGTPEVRVFIDLDEIMVRIERRLRKSQAATGRRKF